LGTKKNLKDSGTSLTPRIRPGEMRQRTTKCTIYAADKGRDFLFLLSAAAWQGVWRYLRKEYMTIE
jgi:hypothetical protein